MRRGNNKGFTLLEFVITAVSIGTLSGIVVSRIANINGQAMASAAESDITSMKQALVSHMKEHGSYEIGIGSYSGVDGYEEFCACCEKYILLPDTTNFFPVHFTYAGDTCTFKIEVKVRNREGTRIVGTPTEVYRVLHTRQGTQRVEDS
jgi:type II secretory pathway pseudopilin PulG